MGAKGQPKTGGRTKGTPNKQTEGLIEKALQLGKDPFEILCLFANGDWKALGFDAKEKIIAVTKSGEPIYDYTISPELRQKSAKDAAEYLYPKRKAIELTGKDGGPLDVYLSMSKEERDRRRKELEAMLDK